MGLFSRKDSSESQKHYSDETQEGNNTKDFETEMAEILAAHGIIDPDGLDA